MLSVNLGPIALSAKLLILLSGVLAAGGIGFLAARKPRAGIFNVLADMLLAGILVARIVFVARWFDIYSKTPWSMIDIRDGGFSLPAGIVAALLVAAWHGRRPEMRKPLVIGLAAGALAWSASFALLRHKIDKPMPGIALQTLAGASTTLPALVQGKPAVVNLWATWCPPCQREMPAFSAIQQQERDVAFVFASQGETQEAVTQYLDRNALPLANVVLDPGRQIGRAVGSSTFPTTLFYDASGRLVDAHVGELSHASLAAKLIRVRASAP